MSSYQHSRSTRPFAEPASFHPFDIPSLDSHDPLCPADALDSPELGLEGIGEVAQSVTEFAEQVKRLDDLDLDFTLSGPYHLASHDRPLTIAYLRVFDELRLPVMGPLEDGGGFERFRFGHAGLGFFKQGKTWTPETLMDEGAFHEAVARGVRIALGETPEAVDENDPLPHGSCIYHRLNRALGAIISDRVGMDYPDLGDLKPGQPPAAVIHRLQVCDVAARECALVGRADGSAYGRVIDPILFIMRLELNDLGVLTSRFRAGEV